MATDDTETEELIVRAQGGDDSARQQLLVRHRDRLRKMVVVRLDPRLAARVDAEDVVMSAYRSFFRLAREGEVVLQQSGDLWRLLARITLRKVCRSARRHLADCRIPGRAVAFGVADDEVGCSVEVWAFVK